MDGRGYRPLYIYIYRGPLYRELYIYRALYIGPYIWGTIYGAPMYRLPIYTAPVYMDYIQFP